MSRYIVGIDLGTTHTVVACAEADAPAGEIRLFDIEQLVAPGEVAARPMLPSLRYHPAPGEFAEGDTALPFSFADPAGLPQPVIGALARARGVQVPGRLVASAKSWLSHAAVDRTAPILPWSAEAGVPKVSPVAASAGYLAHVRAAWNARHPDAPLERQQLVLTVPASFDEGARMLTLQAARDAGLPDVRLLEEPQAAFYDWLHRHRESIDAELAGTRLVLVVDVGGGTTDLTLIRVEPQPDGPPRLTRIGVGNHLMLGGDNMDLALAHLAEQRLAALEGAGAQPGARLSASRMSQLIERCRAAKERLLAADAPERVAVTLLGAGSRLVGGTRTVELSREEVERLVVDGFFPRVAPDEPVRRARSGLVEFGLPYASDAAVTRHVGSFLSRHAAESRLALGGNGGEAEQGNEAGGPPVPDTLLLNGGVFRADALARRLQETLADWRGAPLRLLHNDNPDVAVARGAVAFALAREGRSPRIGGGSPRSYFLLLDDAGKNKGRDEPPSTVRGVCVLPRGSQEGQELRLQERSFALRLGRPVRFHLASTTAGSGSQAEYRLGELVTLDEDAIVRLPPIATVVAPGGAQGRREVPVQLATTLTEVGTLEMHCVSAEDPGQRWFLEFQLRGDAADEAADAAREASGDEGAALPRFKEAVERIDRVFGPRSQQVGPKEVKQLRAQLEHLLGARERWPTPLLRRLFDALWQRAKARRRSADHERVWLNLAGFCLRPGFGDPLDGWRIEQLWGQFEPGVQHGHDAQVASEWWTLWRRVAGGLPEEAQLRLLDDFAWNLQGAESGQTRPPNLVKGGFDDMLRLGASLERIPAEHKAEIGEWLLERLSKPGAAKKVQANAKGAGGKGEGQDAADARLHGLILWAIGRIGARQPFHGSAHAVVTVETVSGWLEALLALDWRRTEAAAFAAAHLARMTGDRSRDIGPGLRAQVIERLQAAHAAPSWIAMVREVVQLDEATEKRVFGEALPPGLKLIG